MDQSVIESMYQLFIDELRFFEKHSYYLSQSMRNQDECGELVELAIRKFLRQVVGERFSITHGYIYSARGLSPQIDIIITDKLVPHRFKCFEHLDNLEIVPAEAVVGIFEIKRTLSKTIITKATDHLQKIYDHVPLSKSNQARYLPGGIEIKGVDGGKYSNPIIGIIGLLHTKTQKKKAPITKLESKIIDIVFSLQGFFCAPDDGKGGIEVLSCRKNDNPINYRAILDINNPEKVLMIFTGYLLGYLNEISGRTFNMNNYFSYTPNTSKPTIQSKN